MEAEILQTWKAEIEAELVEANAALTTATEALAAAVTARDVARAEHRRVTTAIDGVIANRDDAGARYFGQPQTGIPSAFARRADPTHHAMHRADGGVTYAKQVVENAKRRADDARDALDLIAKTMNPAGGEPQNG